MITEYTFYAAGDYIPGHGGGLGIYIQASGNFAAEIFKPVPLHKFPPDDNTEGDAKCQRSMEDCAGGFAIGYALQWARRKHLDQATVFFANPSRMLQWYKVYKNGGRIRQNIQTLASLFDYLDRMQEEGLTVYCYKQLPGENRPEINRACELARDGALINQVTDAAPPDIVTERQKLFELAE